ncbi:hypothetical protein AAHA92_02494 [Salvia divinorum]|uniref:DUF674 family protein n=1 Tax=Salvia divinorum TaxID=28513 RepID=A0ABD1IEW7_SALDI
MSDATKFSLNVMINKDKNEVLFAEADNNFVDIVLNFLTLPLGRIIKVLHNHEAAAGIGSLTNLYHSLQDLDSSYFLTEGAKKALLNPTSSSESEYNMLKVDITDSPPPEYFKCSKCPNSGKTANKRSETGSGGVYTTHVSSFIISDDLRILPSDKGYSNTISFLRIRDSDKAETINVDFGFNEVIKLLKASLTSQSPLSEVILNQTGQMNYMVSKPEIAMEQNPNSKNISLKVLIQKSTGKLLYALAKEDFVEFLFSLLNIPLGGVEHLFVSSTSVKAIDNLHQSASYLIGDDHFKSLDTKNKLIKPNVVHDCISKNHIIPLTQEGMPNYSWLCTHKFPRGKGSYVEGPRTYQVKDDLTVTPYSCAAVLSSVLDQKILLSDVGEVEVQIGLKEALCILRASLTSTSALTDALLEFTSTNNQSEKSES